MPAIATADVCFTQLQGQLSCKRHASPSAMLLDSAAHARYGLSTAALRQVAAELEDVAARQLDMVGGEGLQGAVARSSLHDILGGPRCSQGVFYYLLSTCYVVELAHAH
jgi:hypothetical protein